MFEEAAYLGGKDATQRQDRQLVLLEERRTVSLNAFGRGATEQLTAEEEFACVEGAGPSSEELERTRDVFRAALDRLQPFTVVIPYAEEIAAGIPMGKPRARRDVDRACNIIAAHVLLHQYSHDRDERGRLIADLSDYDRTYAIIQHVLGHSLTGLTDRALGIIDIFDELEDEAAQRLEASKEPEQWSSSDRPAADTADLVARADIQKLADQRDIAGERTVRSRCAQFVEMGLWEEVRHKGNRVHYRKIRDYREEPLALITPAELRSKVEGTSASVALVPYSPVPDPQAFAGHEAVTPTEMSSVKQQDADPLQMDIEDYV